MTENKLGIHKNSSRVWCSINKETGRVVLVDIYDNNPVEIDFNGLVEWFNDGKDEAKQDIFWRLLKVLISKRNSIEGKIHD